MVRVKICCIASLGEAALAVRHGAAALGLVGHMPSGLGVIDDPLIAEIATSAPPAVATFLLTSETEPEAIVDHVRRCGTNTVQIVDAVAPAAYRALRRDGHLDGARLGSLFAALAPAVGQPEGQA